MENATISEDAIDGGTPRTDVGAPATNIGQRPVLKQLPLALIVAVRNPRHTTRVSPAASISQGTKGSQAAQRTGPVYAAPDGVVHTARSTRVTHAAYAVDSAGATGDASGNSEATDTDSALEGLARSLGAEEDPRLAEPPVVEELPDGRYRLCAGERRVAAARLANWTTILCLVYPPMDPVRAHTLGLVENLHRAPMHPLEEISALCISRLLANADARGVASEARRLLEHAWEEHESSYSIIRSLERLLNDAGWSPDRPEVSWKAHLDDLGISMAPWERKRKLRLLNIQPAQQERLRRVDITEAALHTLGTLEPGDQEKVVDALIRNPALARKVRRIARARRDGFYDTIEDALSEVQGWRSSGPEYPAYAPYEITPADWSTTPALTAPAPPTRSAARSAAEIEQGEQPHPQIGVGAREPGVPAPFMASMDAVAPPVWEAAVPVIGSHQSSAAAQSTGAAVEEQVPPEIQDAVLQLLECAERLSSALATLRRHRGGAPLAEPWCAWSDDALDFIKREVDGES